MIPSSRAGPATEDENCGSDPECLDEIGNQRLTSALPVLCQDITMRETGDVGKDFPSHITSKTHARPIKILVMNKHTSAAVSNPAPVTRPNGLPLQFIDQQELRHSSGSDLRRVVRSHARRNVDLKRRHVRANLKARYPRPLREKEIAIKSLVPKDSRNHPVDLASPSRESMPKVPAALPHYPPTSSSVTPSNDDHLSRQSMLHFLLVVSFWIDFQRRITSDNMVHQQPPPSAHCSR